MKKLEFPPPQKKRREKSKEKNCCAQEYDETQTRLINSAERNASFLELVFFFLLQVFDISGGTLDFGHFVGARMCMGVTRDKVELLFDDAPSLHR